MADSGIGRRRAAAKKDGGAAYAKRREELIRAASQLFREKGYQATTLNDIAERVGTDRASLYYYIATKEELLQDAVKGVTEETVALAEDLLERDIPASEKVLLLTRRLLESYEQNYPQVFVYIQEDMTKVSRQKSAWARLMVRQTRRLEEILREILQRGIDDGEFRSDLPADLAANALWGMVNWAHRWFKPGGAQSGLEVADSFASIFLEGIDASRSSS